MSETVIEWAGKERLFRLTMGGVLDLEQAVGEGIGKIFVRLSSGQFSVRDVHETMRLGLIGGGLGVLDAKRLLDAHFETRPGGYMENATIAATILTDLMTGIEPAVADAGKGEPNGTFAFSELSQICRVFHMSPQDLRDMRYADFVNLVRGFNASKPDKKAPHISEEEFIDILNRYEPEAIQ